MTDTWVFMFGFLSGLLVAGGVLYVLYLVSSRQDDRETLDTDPEEAIVYCQDCGRRMTLVRPGKWQCDNIRCALPKTAEERVRHNLLEWKEELLGKCPEYPCQSYLREQSETECQYPELDVAAEWVRNMDVGEVEK